MPFVETTRFASGPVELVCLAANVMRRTTGVGEEMTVAVGKHNKPRAIVVEMPREAHLYNSRTGKYHGLARRLRDRFDPATARIYAALPYKIKKLSARALGKLRAGADARVRIDLAVEGGVAGEHIIRCDVYDPKGKWASYYSKNVVTDGGRGELTIPFAQGDPAGSWRLELRDAVSGQKAKVRLKVAAGRR